MRCHARDLVSLATCTSFVIVMDFPECLHPFNPLQLLSLRLKAETMWEATEQCESVGTGSKGAFYNCLLTYS